ncbi:uncharacterized protein LOC121054917 [Oryza brachyantha]|uniref:uncharacterized protein LOC121054917 n=1 Tax=Oryza brachyantha TaxID=4533 RepID=UPI001ADCEE88|nr:uncharacterized protein LOC121054917 [Oryza brachyantha]
MSRERKGDDAIIPHGRSGDYSAVGHEYSTSTSYSSYSGRAPYINGTEYAAWKHRMKMLLKSINPSIWRTVENDYVLQNPTAPTEEDDKNEHKNAQATNALLSALSSNEFNRVDGTESAKKIWDTLRNVHEGTDGVRESKVEILKVQLERFVLKPEETPCKMYDRLSKIVNEIKGLGYKDMTDSYVVKKMLRAITPRNSTFVTLIQSKDACNFISQGSTPKKQDIALKAVKEAEVDEECTSQAENDMALFVRRLGKYMRRSGFFKGGASKSSFGKSRGRHSSRKCFECGETGHFIAECPKLDDDKKKKKEERGKLISVMSGPPTPRATQAQVMKMECHDLIDEICGSDDDKVEDELVDELSKESLPTMCELLDTVEGQESLLEKQEDMLIREKERNLELEKKVESLEKAYHSLEDKLDTLNKCSPSLIEISKNSKESSNEPYVKCKYHDLDACTSNAKAVKALTAQNKKLMGLLNNGLLKCHMGSKALKEYLGYQHDKHNREGLGYIPPPKGRVDRSVMIKKIKGLDNFVKAKSILPITHMPHCSFDTS